MKIPVSFDRPVDVRTDRAIPIYLSNSYATFYKTRDLRAQSVISSGTSCSLTLTVPENWEYRIISMLVEAYYVMQTNSYQYFQWRWMSPSTNIPADSGLGARAFNDSAIVQCVAMKYIDFESLVHRNRLCCYRGAPNDYEQFHNGTWWGIDETRDLFDFLMEPRDSFNASFENLTNGDDCRIKIVYEAIEKDR